MANFQDINYALISALYANKTSGLYSDVYFPIIKYTIVQLFNQRSREQGAQYYTAEDVHDFIYQRFKIHIPIIVLTKSLVKICNTDAKFVDIVLMENGNSFQVKQLWDSQEFDVLVEREEFFSNGLRSIEDDYKHFLEQHGTYDDGVSYLQFIADNTEEVLGYFQNSDTSVIDEKYTTIIFFLEYLHQTPSKKDEFYIADKLFWASIIAGYLRSEKTPIEYGDEGHIKEYFLDTSIILGLLNLSSKQKERYSQEICDIINASGGVMKVHPMTLEEIKIILSSVEASSGPDQGSDIAEAWENYGLSINKLASIRLNLRALLEKKGVRMFPIVGPEECKKITNKYIGRKEVEDLARERSRNQMSYCQDNFREIHDLFMDDYIKSRRKALNESENSVFVTANKDLIAFTRRLHPESNYMISTGKIVLELWMHNAKPSDISSCALTEAMARCLDHHNHRVRNKICEVSRFFNENKGNFDPQVYEDFVRKLYQRAKNVIMTVEVNVEDTSNLGGVTSQNILDAVKADQEYTDKRIAEIEAKRMELTNKLADEVRSNEELFATSEMHKEHIATLQKDNKKLACQISSINDKIVLTEKKIEEETSGRKNAEEIITLYRRRDVLSVELQEVLNDLDPMIKLREKSFSNHKWMAYMIIALVLIVLAVLLVIFRCDMEWVKLISGFMVSIGVTLYVRGNYIKDNEEKLQKKAYEKWENKPANYKYKSLVTRKEEIKEEVEKINDSLKERE